MSIKVNAAPKIGSGDSIELSGLKGKLCGVQVLHRQEIETKFGLRKMSTVRIMMEGSPEPLEGILFQSYFQGLEIGEWYVGVLTHEKRGDNLMWGLDASKIDKKKSAALVKAIEALPAVSEPSI